MAKKSHVSDWSPHYELHGDRSVDAAKVNYLVGVLPLKIRQFEGILIEKFGIGLAAF